MLHTLGSRGHKEKSFVLKVDINKAFDTIEWGFIEKALKAVNIPQKLARLTISCDTNGKVTILINGKGDGFIMPTHGLRQVCPLSPFLFIIAMKFLSKGLAQAIQQEEIRGLKVANTAPILSHILYADDLVLTGSASTREV